MWLGSSTWQEPNETYGIIRLSKSFCSLHLGLESTLQEPSIAPKLKKIQLQVIESLTSVNQVHNARGRMKAMFGPFVHQLSI